DVVLFDLPAAIEREAIRTRSGAVVGAFVRERAAVEGEIGIVATPVEARSPLVRVRVRVDNLTEAPEPGASRDEALRSSLLGAHTLLALVGAEFVSMVDPPEWARGAVEGCKNLRTWPGRVGTRTHRGGVRT